MIENAAPFFADFGIEATLQGVVVRGIFDDAYGESFSGMVSGSGPMLRLPSSVAVARGNTVVIGTQSYTVRSIEPDGTGITTLRLEAQ